MADLAKIDFTDKELEDFVNLYKSKTKTEGEDFELVKGKDIKYWYDEDNYFEDYGEGPLSNSCMKDVDRSYFDIYSDSKCCQLLILTKKVDKKKLLIGRALVWKPSEMTLKDDVKFEGTKYFMDRIYCMKSSDEQKFLNYAEEKGWLVKAHNNSDNETGMIFKFKGQVVKLKIVCKVEGDCEDYPYMDTLKYLSKEKDEISNIGFIKGYELEDTGGSPGIDILEPYPISTGGAGGGSSTASFGGNGGKGGFGSGGGGGAAGLTVGRGGIVVVMV